MEYFVHPRILIVDDSDFTAIHLEGLIGGDYRIEHRGDGESGVAAAMTDPPNVILMDVEMPGMDGYTACRLLKKAPVTQDVPVVFLSSHAETADRLAGYEAGGEDYITKPFDPDELSRKVGVVLRNHRKRRELVQNVNVATRTAMTAMSSVGDIGIIMRFLGEMVGCLDFPSVADCIMGAMRGFGLDVAMQLRDEDESLSLSGEGICSALEESVLHNMASCARIVDLGSRSAFNYPRVTIIVKDMPRDNPEHYGRIKDNLATLTESVDVHLRSLSRVKSALRRGDTMLALLQRSMTTLKDIETRYRTQRAASSQILNALAFEIEDSFISLGLTEGQERRLQNTLRTAIDQAQAIYDEEVESDRLMRNFSQDLEAVLEKEAAAAAPAPATSAAPNAAPESSIELF